MEKQFIKRGPKRMTEKHLAANRRNALMAGRPAGSMNAEKIAFRDRFRSKEVELADDLIHLALHAPGMVGTMPELQRGGFNYANSG